MDIQAGWHIRFRATPASDWHVGTVETTTTDSIGVRLCVSCRSETYSFADLDRIDARTKVGGSHWVQGAALGALVGIGVDALLILQCDHGSHGQESRALCGLGFIYAPPFALAGALIGGITGAQIPKRDWLTVYKH